MQAFSNDENNPVPNRLDSASRNLEPVAANNLLPASSEDANSIIDSSNVNCNSKKQVNFEGVTYC